MCGGMEFYQPDPKTGDKRLKKVFFPIPHAQVPVMTDEGVQWVQWGKRQGEDPEYDIPVTGWARLGSLVEGKWNEFSPHKVRIPVVRWMEKDANKTSHWFDMEPETCLLGVKIDRAERSFVYVVTRQARGEWARIHHRIPLIVPARTG